MNNSRLIASIKAVPVRWAFRKPFVTALGRRSFTDNVLVRVRLRSGIIGWGEASGSLARPDQTRDALLRAVRTWTPDLLGRDVRDAGSAWVENGSAFEANSAAAGALEAALWDAFAASEGIPFFLLFGRVVDRLETTYTVSLGSPEEAGRAARAAYARGFRILKVKLNGRDELDRDRIRAVSNAGAKVRCVLDANQSHTPASLVELLDGLKRDGIAAEVIEEPFPKKNWRVLSRFRSLRPKADVVLDESVQNAGDAAYAARRRLSSGANIKLAKSGLAGGVRIVDAFIGNPKPRMMIGCMAESCVGLSAAVHLAMALGVFGIVDLDSDVLLKNTGVRAGYVRKGPFLTLPKRPLPGLGVRMEGRLN